MKKNYSIIPEKIGLALFFTLVFFVGTPATAGVLEVIKNTSLTIEEIEGLKKFIKEKEEAINLDESLPLSLTSTVVYASTLPGSKSVVINMQKGFDVSLEIVDQNNKPWNISLISRGGDNIVSTIQAKPINNENNKIGNVVLFSPKTIGRANKIFHLEEQSTPISIILNVTAKSIDHDRYTIIVTEENSTSKKERIENDENYTSNFINEDKELLSVLSGITPEGYEKIIGINGEKYQINVLSVYQPKDENSEFMLLRTSADLLAPEPASTVTKDTLKAYKIPKATLLLMVNDNGKDVEVSLLRGLAY